MFNCVTTPGNINYLSVCWLPMFVVVGKPPMEVSCGGMSVFIYIFVYRRKYNMPIFPCGSTLPKSCHDYRKRPFK